MVNAVCNGVKSGLGNMGHMKDEEDKERVICKGRWLGILIYIPVSDNVTG